MTENSKRMLDKTIKKRHINTGFILIHSNRDTSRSHLPNSKGFH